MCTDITTEMRALSIGKHGWAACERKRRIYWFLQRMGFGFGGTYGNGKGIGQGALDMDNGSWRQQGGIGMEEVAVTKVRITARYFRRPLEAIL